MEFIASGEEEDNIWMSASDGNITRVEALLNNGVSVNTQDENGYSPLHAAVSYGHLDLMELLLSAGADINLRDSGGDTPLLFCEQGDVLEFLLLRGANLSDTNTDGESLLDKVIEDENDDFLEYLIAHGHFVGEKATKALEALRKQDDFGYDDENEIGEEVDELEMQVEAADDTDDQKQPPSKRPHFDGEP